MRAISWLLGGALLFGGCARYAEVTKRRPSLTGPPGTGLLATAEQKMSRVLQREHTHPRAALGDCLAALDTASRELRLHPGNPAAVRDYNFALSRVIEIVHDAKLDLWSGPLTVHGEAGDYVLTYKPDPRPEW